MARYSKLKRIYCEENISTDSIIEVAGDKFVHLKNVLRVRAGEQFRIFNMIDGEYIAKISEVGRKNVICHVQQIFRQPETTKQLTLALAVIKPDKFLEAVRGAVQLGATKITPVMMANSQKTNLNEERIHKCIIETCEQCESLTIPTISKILTFDQFLSQSDNAQIFFADENANDSTNNFKRSFTANEIDNPVILIGPEGGFTDKERRQLTDLQNVRIISLGQNVLRAEIAAISALSIIQFLLRVK